MAELMNYNHTPAWLIAIFIHILIDNFLLAETQEVENFPQSNLFNFHSEMSQVDDQMLEDKTSFLK